MKMRQKVILDLDMRIKTIFFFKNKYWIRELILVAFRYHPIHDLGVQLLT